MGARWLLGVAVLCTACGASRSAAVKDSEPIASEARSGPVRYVDEALGFEIVRPSAEWLLDDAGETTPEGLAIPVVLRHRVSGAQVVLQVAPAVASPSQFAERLTEGLRQQPGFITSDPAPIPLSDSAVGFDFSVGDGVRGRVAVRDGSPGNIFMMLATWPTSAPEGVPQSVDALFEGVRPLRVPERG